jgi:S-adenosylmethionine-diacylglycerol 3-amino-3-carboxypropyl transferase
MEATTTQPQQPTSRLSKGLLRKAIHQSSLLSRQGMLERLFTTWFQGFVYNQIWEDPRVDMEAMELRSDSRILTISSGGCNVLNYLTAGPERIVGVDLNRCHMSLTRLKLCGLKHLPDYETFFAFFGKANDPKNLENYRKYIRPHLEEDARRYWDGSSLSSKLLFRGPRIRMFTRNIYNYAKLGLLLRVTHTLGKLVRRDPKRMLEAKTLQEQEQVFDEYISNFFDKRIVRAIANVPLVLYSLGIPPQQYRHLKQDAKGNIADLYRERVRRLACGFPLEDNYFAWQAFSRSYDPSEGGSLPEYLKKENYEALRANADHVETHITTLTEFMASQPEDALDRFVFLDAQDWMNPQQIDDLWRHIFRVGRDGTRIVFRTASSQSPVEGSLGPDIVNHFRYLEEYSRQLHTQDRSAIYGGFHVYHMSK